MSKRILIAEDSSEIAESIEFFLRREGHEVLVVGSIEQTLAEVADFAPDLILVDTCLADGCGIDLCQTLRQKRAPESLYIVLIASGADVAHAERWRDAGADDFLTKPLVTLELLQRLRPALEPALDRATGS